MKHQSKTTNPFNNSNPTTMNQQKLIITIVAAIGALSIFLPWVSLFLPGGALPGVFSPTITANGAHHVGGWIGFILYAISIAYCVFAGNREKALQTKKDKLIVAIPALIALIVGGAGGCAGAFTSVVSVVLSAVPRNDLAALEHTMKMNGINGMADLWAATSLQFGFYLFIIAGLAVAILAFVMKAKDESKT